MSNESNAIKPDVNGKISFIGHVESIAAERARYAELEARYDGLQARCDGLQTKRDELQNKYDELQTHCAEAKKELLARLAAALVYKPPVRKRFGKTVEEAAAERKKAKAEAPSPFDVKWDAKYDECVAYHEANGNIDIPKDNQLYDWLSQQRSQHNRLKSGKPSKLKPDRIQRLNALGMRWSLSRTLDWSVRFQQLIEYKAQHGHTNVPHSSKGAVAGLGIFVRSQRTMYQAHNLGLDISNKVAPAIAEERIAKLNEIDFVWSLRNRPRRSVNL